MTDKSRLTETQGNVLNFLKKFIEGKGYPPTLREIASHFGLRGPKAPQKTLNILERKGYIRRTPGGSRTIELLGFKIGAHRGLAGDIKFGDTPTYPVPIIGRVTAGEPILAIENIEGYIHLDRSLVSSKNVFLLRVEGTA